MPRIRSHFLVLAFCAAVIISAAVPIASASAANPADLDPSFGSNGLATSHLSNSIETVTGVSVLPDGRLAWGGWGYDTSIDDYGFLLGKLTPGGAADPAFGNSAGSVARSHFGTGINYGNAFAVQPDGNLIVAGNIASLDPTGLVARFSADGALDTAGFATPTGAYQEPDFEINAVGTQPGGKILMAGSNADDFKIWRLTSAGASDPTLTGGVSSLTTDIGETDQAQDMVVLPDGGFALAGTAHFMPGGNALAVVKYLANGALDTSFSGDGKMTIYAPPLNYPVGQSIVAQPDGKLVVAMNGDTVNPARTTVLARFLPNGDPDPSFGTGGFASTPLDGVVGANDLALQADGKIVVTASSTLSPSMVVGRFLPNGQVDFGFGTGGYTSLNLSAGTDQANTVAIQPDGKIVIGGSVNPLNSIQADDWAVVRLRGGEPTVAPALVPASKISNPKKSSLKRKKFTRISGTAGPKGAVAKVEIAVRKIDAKSLKKKRCVWLRSNKAKFKKNKSTSKKKCTTRVWLKAKGTSKWSFSLSKKRYLPKGSYEIFSRVTLTDGTRQTTFTKKAGNFKKLKLTK